MPLDLRVLVQVHPLVNAVGFKGSGPGAGCTKVLAVAFANASVSVPI